MTAGSARRALGDDAFPAWARSLEDRLDDLARAVGRPRTFTTVAARNTAFPHPKRGDQCMVGTSRHLHDGTGWLGFDNADVTSTPTIVGASSGTLAVGTGGVYYMRTTRRGHHARCQGHFTVGTSGFTIPVGSWRMSPAAGLTPAMPPTTETPHRLVGCFTFDNDTAARQFGMANIQQSIVADKFYFIVTGGQVSDATPQVWAASDQFSWDFEYELSATDRYV